MYVYTDMYLFSIWVCREPHGALEEVICITPTKKIASVICIALPSECARIYLL